MKVGKYTIKWRHQPQKLVKLQGASELVLPVRSYTACIIEYEGYQGAHSAFCHPADNFCKDTGRRLSLARCMKDMKIPKEDREMIWKAYRDMTPKKRW